MKKIHIILCTAFVLISAFVPSHQAKSGIHGIIDPADAAVKVWAISGTDSVSTVPVTGSFSIPVKPGNWTVVVIAVKPYQNAVVENISVLEGESADTGVIKLRSQ